MISLKNGTSWESSGKIAIKSPIQGAGSLMRTIPIGMFNRKNPQKNIVDSENISKITHASKISINSCVVYDQIIAEIINQDATYGDLKTILEYTMNLPTTIPEIHKSMDSAMKRENQIENYQNRKPNVLIIFETSIWILLTTNSYYEAIIKAINLGGDTDTTAAITGGLAGCLYGFESIPDRWLEPILQKEAFMEQGKKLYELVK